MKTWPAAPSRRCCLGVHVHVILLFAPDARIREVREVRQRHVRWAAVVGADHHVDHVDELDAEHRAGGRVVRDQLVDDVREHRGIGDRGRRARHHHAASQQPREHPLDAARHRAQHALVDRIERQADELRDQQARIGAPDLERTGRAPILPLLTSQPPLVRGAISLLAVDVASGSSGYSRVKQ